MIKKSFSMQKKSLIFLLVICATVYLLFWSRLGLSTIIYNRPIPDYILTDDRVSRIYQNRLQLYRPENSSSNINTFVYIPTEFNENEAYISDLLRHNGYVAAILSEEFANEVLFPSPTFSCTCGRVSDPCVCCGILQPQVSGQNNLSPDLYQPILLTTDNTKAAQLCMNTTYLPNKKQIKTSAVLVNLTSSQGDFSGKLDSVIRKSDKKMMKSTYLSTVFDTVFLPSSPLPVICSGRSKNNYVVDLCVNFTTLEYRFDSDSDHKTVFHACAFIQVVLNRIFIIAKYPKFCFDAHRGAAGDADQASNNKMFNKDVLINPSNPSADYSLVSSKSEDVSYVKSLNYSKSRSTKILDSSFQLVNRGNENPKSPLQNSHDLHRGIP